MSRREQIGAPDPGGPALSPAIVAEGRFVFVSGQLSIVDGSFVSGSIEEEVANALACVEAVLARVDAGLEDVVRTNVYLSDIGDFLAMDAEYRRHFRDSLPARTTLGAQLALGAKVEIDCIAVLPAVP